MKKILTITVVILACLALIIYAPSAVADEAEVPNECQELLQELLEKETVVNVTVNVNCCCNCEGNISTESTIKEIVTEKENISTTVIHQGDTIIDKSHDNYHPKDDDKIHNNGNGNNGNNASNNTGQINGDKNKTNSGKNK